MEEEIVKNEEITPQPVIEEKDELTKLKEAVITRLNTRDFGIYFFTLDTKGNATAGVANIYEHVKILNELGYKASILHEKSDYARYIPNENLDTPCIESWLGKEYADLPHVCIADKKLNVGPQDFVVIPEVFSSLMEQTMTMPCKRIVFCQAYDYIFEILPPGKYWIDYNITDCITTSQKQADYINSLFQTIKTYVIPVSIPEYFTPYHKIQKPVVALLAREQIDLIKLIKQFYIQYPHYRWVAFKDLRGLSRKDFARSLQESCLAVWIDDIAGFGTFPIECFECEIPVIAKLPNMVPEWMIDHKTEDGNYILRDCGLWISNPMELPAVIADFLKGWIEDSIPENLYQSIKSQKGKYTPEKQREAVEQIYGELINKRIVEIINLKK